MWRRVATFRTKAKQSVFDAYIIFVQTKLINEEKGVETHLHTFFIRTQLYSFIYAHFPEFDNPLSQLLSEAILNGIRKTLGGHKMAVFLHKADEAPAQFLPHALGFP